MFWVKEITQSCSCAKISTYTFVNSYSFILRKIIYSCTEHLITLLGAREKIVNNQIQSQPLSDMWSLGRTGCPAVTQVNNCDQCYL